MLWERMLDAKITIKAVEKRFGIPADALAGSEIQVKGNDENGKPFWYDAVHNGVDWDIIREHSILYCKNDADLEFGYLKLSARAMKWLENWVDSKTTTEGMVS